MVGAPAGGRPHLDAAGALLVTTGLAILVYAPTAGTETGWTSIPFVAALALSGGLLAAFVYHEHRSPHPLLPLSLLRSRTLAGGDVAALLVGAWNAAEVLVLALFLQDDLGYAPLAAGLVAIPQGVGGLVRGLIGPSAVARLGIKRFLALNAALAAIGLALLIRFPATSHGVFLALVLLVIGFGSTNVIFAATVAASTGVPNDEQGVAGGLVNTTRQVGAALGVATLLSVAQAGDDGSNITPASGYRLALGVAAGLAVLATAVALVLIPDRRTTD
jgi:predicted MFS family arabinose efflux permease